jgi:hypothetical protein
MTQALDTPDGPEAPGCATMPRDEPGAAAGPEAVTPESDAA